MRFEPCAHAFPGNVRELRNVPERAALLCDGAVVERTHVERALGAAPRVGRSTPPASQQPAPRLQAAPRSLREVETETLRVQLAAHRGSRADLARTLGISERSLYRKLRALQMP